MPVAIPTTDNGGFSPAIKGGPTSAPPSYTISVDDDSQEKLLNDLPSIDAQPLWKQMSVLVPAKPKPKAVAHKWSSVAIARIL